MPAFFRLPQVDNRADADGTDRATKAALEDAIL